MKAMEKFIEKVAKMRELQKRYFKERSITILQECKKTEREVDQMISEHQKPIDNQQSLFS